MEKEKTVMLLHLVVGIVAGYLSYVIFRPLYAAVLMLVILLIMKQATNTITKEKKKAGWWFGNGGVVYIFVWFVSWIVFFNLLA